MASDRDQDPTVKLARDEFTVERRKLDGHPEAVAASSRIDVTDDYGNVTTWVVDRGATDGYTRMLVPPLVTAAIARHHRGLASKHRKNAARRSIADLRAQSGEHVESPRRRRRKGKA